MVYQVYAQKQNRYREYVKSQREEPAYLKPVSKSVLERRKPK